MEVDVHFFYVAGDRNSSVKGKRFSATDDRWAYGRPRLARDIHSWLASERLRQQSKRSYRITCACARVCVFRVSAEGLQMFVNRCHYGGFFRRWPIELN